MNEEVEAKAAYEKAAWLLNQWYTMIKRHEALQAVSLRYEIQNLLSKMEKSGDLELYFQLLDYRCKLMMEQFQNQPSFSGKLKGRRKRLRARMTSFSTIFSFFQACMSFMRKTILRRSAVRRKRKRSCIN
ncbi:hypothetical protein [Bacillus licheniformis]|uniref:response regulator aspartate phosphatase n=1 Tax=Bacillus licheniformis TaxID=1402 RepID=UPI002E1C3056|nr:hypothetical protein [Bacillus licheniformis]MED4381815.1 hypothetical protein [Bacillus licheniformis]